MTCLGNDVVRKVKPLRSSVLAATASVLALFAGGCTCGSASPPDDGAGGGVSQVMTATGGAGGAVTAEGGMGGTPIAAGGGGGPATGAGGQGGGAETPPTCPAVAPSGIGVPPGTVVTVSGADDTDPAGNAIDGDITNEWSLASSTGWITLTFPTPVMIGAVVIHADAKPVSNELFTLTTSTSAVPLASARAGIGLMADGGTLLPEFSIPPGLYQDLTLTVDAGESWVGVNEIWLFPAPICP